MTESQKEFLFRAMLKELGVSRITRNSSDYITYDFIITKKFLFRTFEYKIGHFTNKNEFQYYFYGMPETNQKILDLLREHFSIKDITLVMMDDNPMRYNDYGIF
jgi:hypothetical protein